MRFAARLAPTDDCDIIILFVRPVDQGLWSGGLQVRLARQNMMEAGFELPGIRHLKQALDVLKEEGIDAESWPRLAGHQDAWGDPLGDNKIEYQSPEGRTVVLKLKTAPDVAAGILDQYELGPYNLMILGEPSRWRGEFQSLFSAGIVQRVTMLAPCSVLIVRQGEAKQGFFICTDGSAALDAGGSARRGPRPYHRRAHHPLFSGPGRGGPGGSGRKRRERQGAAQGAGDHRRGSARGGRQPGRLHHPAWSAVPHHRRYR